jgi:inorganic pyrophosphatase
MDDTVSLRLARMFLGKKVQVVIDRPLGSTHPKHGFVYEVNYGYVPDTKAPDGEELDAYYLGADKALKEAHSVCIAIIHRADDDDDKLVVVPNGVHMTDEEILNETAFQEIWFRTIVVRH